MKKTPGIVVSLIAAMLLALPCALVAQDKYPSQPVNAIVPFAAGGSSDRRHHQKIGRNTPGSRWS
jgi:tripartite-type tricarboxylate transporter receptor subunit TctC